jgi:hypothetical protein
LDFRFKTNEEERERVVGYIEEIPRLRDRTLRSLVRYAKELENELRVMRKRSHFTSLAFSVRGSSCIFSVQRNRGRI